MYEAWDERVFAPNALLGGTSPSAHLAAKRLEAVGINALPSEHCYTVEMSQCECTSHCQVDGCDFCEWD
jgi:hypothetical protein